MEITQQTYAVIEKLIEQPELLFFVISMGVVVFALYVVHAAIKKRPHE